MLQKREELRLLQSIINDDIPYIEKVFSRVYKQKKSSLNHIHISEYGMLYDPRHTLLDLCIHHNKLQVIRLLFQYGYNLSNIEHLKSFRDTSKCPYPYHQRNLIDGIPSLIWCIYHYKNNEIATYLEPLTDVTTTYKYAYYALKLNTKEYSGFQPLLKRILSRCKSEDIKLAKLQLKKHRLQKKTKQLPYLNEKTLYYPFEEKHFIDNEPLIKELKRYIYYGDICNIKKIICSNPYKKLVTDINSYHTLLNSASYSYQITNLLITKGNCYNIDYNKDECKLIRHPLVDAFGYQCKKVIILLMESTTLQYYWKSSHLLPLVELLQKNSDNTLLYEIFDSLYMSQYKYLFCSSSPTYYQHKIINTELLPIIKPKELDLLIKYIDTQDIPSIQSLLSQVEVNSVSPYVMNDKIGCYHLLNYVKTNKELCYVLLQCGCKPRDIYFDEMAGHDPIIHYLFNNNYELIQVYMFYCDCYSYSFENIERFMIAYLSVCKEKEKGEYKYTVLNNLLRRCNQHIVELVRQKCIQKGLIDHFFPLYSSSDIILTQPI